MEEPPPTDHTHEGGLGAVDLIEIMQAIDMENEQLTGWEHREAEEKEEPPSPTPALHQRPSRTSFVNFSSAQDSQEKEQKQKVAQKTRRRGQVSQPLPWVIHPPRPTTLECMLCA